MPVGPAVGTKARCWASSAAVKRDRRSGALSRTGLRGPRGEVAGSKVEDRVETPCCAYRETADARNPRRIFIECLGCYEITHNPFAPVFNIPGGDGRRPRYQESADAGGGETNRRGGGSRSHEEWLDGGDRDSR